MNDWLSYVRLEGPSPDKAGVIAAVRTLYRTADLDLPIVEFCASPIQALLRAAIRHDLGRARLTFEEYDTKVAAQIRSCWGNTRGPINPLVAIRTGLVEEIRRYLGNLVVPRMAFTTSSLVTSVSRGFPTASFDENSSMSWGRVVGEQTSGFSDLIIHWGQHDPVPSEELPNEWRTLKDGAGWVFAFADVAYICDRAFIRTETRAGSMDTRFAVRERTVLHSDEGPAVSYSDGFVRWMWSGVPVAPEIITTPPDQITLDMVLAQNNSESLSALLARAGPQIWNDHRVIVIDRDRDGANDRRLVQLELRRRTVLVYLLVTCPSTGRHYALSVPPDCRTCGQAAAWTFGMTQSEYAPLIER